MERNRKDQEWESEREMKLKKSNKREPAHLPGRQKHQEREWQQRKETVCLHEMDVHAQISPRCGYCLAADFASHSGQMSRPCFLLSRLFMFRSRVNIKCATKWVRMRTMLIPGFMQGKINFTTSQLNFQFSFCFLSFISFSGRIIFLFSNFFWNLEINTVNSNYSWNEFHKLLSFNHDKNRWNPSLSLQ